MRAEMTPERWQAVKAILQAALARPAPDRATFVAAACDGDVALRAEVEALLAGPDTGEAPLDFLAPPAVAAAIASAAGAAAGDAVMADAGADAADAARVAEALADRYAIERELGRGGMATVYLARDLRHRRSVAIKVLHRELSSALGPERFLREIETTAALQHPHILPLFDSGSAGARLYYVMPYVAGGSLRACMRGGGALPLHESLRVVRGVAAALDYAHRRGVVHRDVKPENVLLDEDGHALVADFGIARALYRAGAAGAERQPLTGTGVVIGTPAYMSPEQALGERDVDGRSDQYALGCIAFELLAGASPFAGSAAEQLVRRLTTAPPSLAAARPELPAAASDVVARALATSPASRFETATAFADALAGALADAPTGRVPVRPRGASDVGGEAAAAHSGGFWRAAGDRRALGGLALAVIGTVWGVRTLRERDAAPPITRPAAGGRPAVLPLKNLSGDPAQEYFADGMTDELTTTLAKIEALHVVAHQSVRQFKRSERPVSEIARLLGVSHVVDGSVLQDGGRVRITTTLIDGATDAPIWTERFERERRGVLALQREVALAVARAVEVALTPQDRARLADAPTVDPAVFDLYVRGTQARYKAFGPDDNYAHAVRFFERAIARDPGYAPAHAGLASVRAVLGDEAARRSAAKALALDPKLAEARMVLGMIHQFFDRDWAGAEEHFRQAIRLNPGYAEARHELSMLLMRRKRFGEALDEARHTVYLAPMSARFEHGLGEVFLFSGRYDEALTAADKALALDSSAAAAHYLRAYAYGQQGRFREAEQSLMKCLALECGDIGRALLGHVYAVTGRRAEAEQIANALRARWNQGDRDAGVAFGIAQIYAGLGDRMRALEWLERGVESGAFMLYAGIDPILRPLHAEPRFRALVRRLGLPE
jgi:serine/threonine-protein kinase